MDGQLGRGLSHRLGTGPIDAQSGRKTRPRIKSAAPIWNGVFRFFGSFYIPAGGSRTRPKALAQTGHDHHHLGLFADLTLGGAAGNGLELFFKLHIIGQCLAPCPVDELG